MKYKRLLVLITCLLFVTVAVFCFTSAFKVKDVELEVSVVSGSAQNVKELCTQNLSKYEDENLLFVDENEIRNELLKLSGYIEVNEVTKTYPNKIFVKVTERKESFVIDGGDKSYAIDLNLNVLSEKSSSLNNVDGKPNVILEFNLSDFNSSSITVGSKIEIFDASTKEYLIPSLSKIFERRENVEKASVLVKKDGHDFKRVVLKMREGVIINIDNANVSFEDKLKTAFEFYDALSNKGIGEYFVVLEDGGNITVKE